MIDSKTKEKLNKIYLIEKGWVETKDSWYSRQQEIHFNNFSDAYQYQLEVDEEKDKILQIKIDKIKKEAIQLFQTHCFDVLLSEEKVTLKVYGYSNFTWKQFEQLPHLLGTEKIDIKPYTEYSSYGSDITPPNEESGLCIEGYYK